YYIYTKNFFIFQCVTLLQKIKKSYTDHSASAGGITEVIATGTVHKSVSDALSFFVIFLKFLSTRCP
ncbi:hypothetical protein KKD51_03070, partial [Patescibacteria group bacterium]|nr:hypothetical protein [Patescibacteria group bacterium]